MPMDGEPALQEAFSGFVSGRKRLLENILSEMGVDSSTISAVKKLDVNKAGEEYGEIGLERYVRSIIDKWDTEGIPTAGKRHSLRGLLKAVITSPATMLARFYDYVLEKTNSHFISTASMGAFVGEMAAILSFTGQSAYYSYALNTSFPALFSEEAYLNSSFFVQLPILTAMVSSAAVGMIVGATSLVFDHKKIEIGEIEDDIKDYVKEFRKIFDSYSKHLFKSGIEDSLQNINAIYMLSSARAYSEISVSEDRLRAYERKMLPYIESVIGKKVNSNLVVHHSPKNVGGFTFIYNSLIGKLFKRKSHSPVFLNTERTNAVPEYLFALFHETAHGAGATTEQMASYYAQRAMEKVGADFPMEGYDLFIAVNKIESAVATLSKKFRSKTEFFSRLDDMGLPRFVKESFDYGFNPYYSITFPVAESMNSGPIESRFSGLYASGPYIAMKMVEKGRVKTF